MELTEPVLDPVRPVRPATARAPAHVLAVRLTSWLLLAFLGLLAYGSLVTMDDPRLTPALRVTGTMINTLVAVGFLLLQQQFLRGSRTRTTTVLSWVTVLLGLLLIPISNSWSLLGISVATAILVAPRYWATPLGIFVWLAGLVEVVFDSTALVTRIGIPLVVLVTALVQVTLTRLAVALTEAQTSREHLARARVDLERHRISRDLHDIIGRTLVAVSLRNEAALQLLDPAGRGDAGPDVERAREQLEYVRDTLARGQAQLRGLTSGPVIADLEDELVSARGLCTRLGISCRIDAVRVPDPQTGMLAARIVRESVTNMLRHSSPRVCEITVERAGDGFSVSVTNDGAPRPVKLRPGAGGGGSGTGIEDLRARVEAAGGRFEATWLRDERYRVWARLPGGHAAGGGTEEPA